MARRRRNKRKHPFQIDLFPDSDKTFVFIVGYTSGGAPYGLTWEELEEQPLCRMMDDAELKELFAEEYVDRNVCMKAVRQLEECAATEDLP